MAAEIANKVLNDEEYADAEYRRFLKEKDKYMDFDEFCRKEGIWSILFDILRQTARYCRAPQSHE